MSVTARLAELGLSIPAVAKPVASYVPATTAGNLVFNGEGNGYFRAFDATSGKKLWEYQCGAGVNN